jgi:hypothetical protein
VHFRFITSVLCLFSVAVVVRGVCLCFSFEHKFLVLKKEKNQLKARTKTRKKSFLNLIDENKVKLARGHNWVPTLKTTYKIWDHFDKAKKRKKMNQYRSLLLRKVMRKTKSAITGQKNISNTGNWTIPMLIENERKRKVRKIFHLIYCEIIIRSVMS